MNSTVRDIVLILIALGLLVAMFLPSTRRDEPPSSPPSSSSLNTPSPAQSTAPDKEMENTAALLADVPHPLFPIVAGARWDYIVKGPQKWVPGERWTMKVLRAPAADLPGEISAGFSENFSSAPVWFENDGLKYAGLPLLAPPSYLNSTPGETTGALLPAMRYIIDDAVWSFQIARVFDYESLGDNRRIIKEKAQALEVDRALVAGLTEVVVPAGVFNAWRVDWICRIEIKAGKGRSVLAELTTEPYRKDSMWFAPGVGLVKRRITYSASPKEDIVFSLVEFTLNRTEGVSK